MNGLTSYYLMVAVVLLAYFGLSAYALYTYDSAWILLYTLLIELPIVAIMAYLKPFENPPVK